MDYKFRLSFYSTKEKSKIKSIQINNVTCVSNVEIASEITTILVDATDLPAPSKLQTPEIPIKILGNDICMIGTFSYTDKRDGLNWKRSNNFGTKTPAKLMNARDQGHVLIKDFMNEPLCEYFVSPNALEIKDQLNLIFKPESSSGNSHWPYYFDVGEHREANNPLYNRF